MAHLVQLVLVLVVTDRICWHSLLCSLVGVGLFVADGCAWLGAFNGVDVVGASVAGP